MVSVDILDILTDNPYSLARDIPEAGFKVADSIALQNGVAVHPANQQSEIGGAWQPNASTNLAAALDNGVMEPWDCPETFDALTSRWNWRCLWPVMGR